MDEPEPELAGADKLVSGMRLNRFGQRVPFMAPVGDINRLRRQSRTPASSISKFKRKQARRRDANRDYTQRIRQQLGTIAPPQFSSEELSSEKRKQRRRSARRIQSAIRRRNQRRPARAQRALLRQAAEQSALDQGVDPRTGYARSLTRAYRGLDPVQAARLGLPSTYGQRRPMARLVSALPITDFETPSQTELRRRLAQEAVERERLERMRTDPLSQARIFGPSTFSGANPAAYLSRGVAGANPRSLGAMGLSDQEIRQNMEAERIRNEIELAFLADLRDLHERSDRIEAQKAQGVESHDPFGTGARDAQRVASEIAEAAIDAGVNAVNTTVAALTSPEAQGMAMMARDIGSAALSMFAPGGRRTVNVPTGARVRYNSDGRMDINPDDQDPSSMPGGSRRRSRRRTKRNRRTKKR